MSEPFGKIDAHMHRFFAFFYDFRMPSGIILDPGRSISEAFSLNFVEALRGAFWIPFGYLWCAF